LTPLRYWIPGYCGNLIFWLWIARWGGAELLEGKFSAGLLIHVCAITWSAEGIKLFAYGCIAVSTIYFILGVFIPDFRFF